MRSLKFRATTSLPCLAALSRSARKVPTELQVGCKGGSYSLSCDACHWRRSCWALAKVSLSALSWLTIRSRIELKVAIYSSSQRTMASLLVRQISRYISGLPAARRETSRNPLAASTEVSLHPPLPATVLTRADETRKGR